MSKTRNGQRMNNFEAHEIAEAAIAAVHGNDEDNRVLVETVNRVLLARDIDAVRSTPRKAPRWNQR